MVTQFQILNGQGIAINLSKLDEEVCALFNQQVDPKKYCRPNGQYNWFDSIGWTIAQMTRGLHTWEEVTEELHNFFDVPNEYELIIGYFMQAGYTPVTL